ncbi:hypothetical protein KKA00_05010, partial [bacterium]|nr:hypothetical protein [bacterium]
MKSSRFICALSFLSIISVAFSGCDFKPKAIGNDNELAILVDADVREAAEGHLLAAFCPIVDTPQPEHRFIPVWGDFEAISRLQTYRFILLVGTLDGKDKLSGLVQQMLSDEIIAGVRRGDYFVFQKKSEWARDQLLLILVAENRQQLIARLEKVDRGACNSDFNWDGIIDGGDLSDFAANFGRTDCGDVFCPG